jgi:shikimate kinase
MKHLPITRIALIGLSGAGKSSVGRELAAQLNWKLLDTDKLIEHNSGQRIPQIFAEQGEEQFREYETIALQQALAQPPAIIATGAGMIMRPINRTLLHEHAFIVWLDAPTAVLVERLRKHDEERPLLVQADPVVRLEALRATRAPLYTESANLTISTLSLTHAQIASRIRKAAQL